MKEPSLFSICFAFLMIQLPLLIVAVYRPRRLATDDAERIQRARRFLMGIVLGTLVADGFVAAASMWYPPIVAMLWTLFFPLWFGLAMPYLALRYPALASAHPSESGLRTASLTPRSVPIPNSAWNIALACWLAIVGLLILALCLKAGLDSHERLTLPILTAIVAMTAIMSRWIGARAVRLLSMEPCPLPPSPGAEAEQAWDRLRLFRARALFYLANLMPAPFAGATASMLCQAPLWLTVTIGAGGGALIGIVGGCVGMIAGTKQASLVQRTM